MVSAPLCASVTAVNAEIRAGDVLAGIGEQEGHRPHEILGHSHLALRDERSPLLLEVRVVVKNLLSPVQDRVSAEIQ